MRRLLVAVVLVSWAGLVAAWGMSGPPARAAVSSPPAVESAARLELLDVAHALQERTLVISGAVHNAGRVAVARLVIDASGYAPTGDLAAFGSDGIPWVVRPGAAERFQIFMPLGAELVSAYTLTVSESRPSQFRRAVVSRMIFPTFYRALILPRVRVDVQREPTALTFTATAEGLPVVAVWVTVNILVQEHEVVLRVLTVEVPVDRPLRLRYAPLILRVVSVSVTDVTLSRGWTSP